MEKLRELLIELINENGPLNERVLKVSQELDKHIVEYYRETFSINKNRKLLNKNE